MVVPIPESCLCCSKEAMGVLWLHLRDMISLLGLDWDMILMLNNLSPIGFNVWIISKLSSGTGLFKDVSSEIRYAYSHYQ